MSRHLWLIGQAEVASEGEPRGRPDVRVSTRALPHKTATPERSTVLMVVLRVRSAELQTSLWYGVEPALAEWVATAQSFYDQHQPAE